MSLSKEDDAHIGRMIKDFYDSNLSPIKKLMDEYYLPGFKMLIREEVRKVTGAEKEPDKPSPLKVREADVIGIAFKVASSDATRGSGEDYRVVRETIRLLGIEIVK